MSQKILLTYSSKYGSTKEVSEKIDEVLEKDGNSVDLKETGEVKNLEEYNTVIIGTAIYIYKLHKDTKKFLKKFKKDLTSKDVILFVLGPVKDPKDEQEWKDSQGQLNKELEQFEWLKPIEVKLFGGRFDPELLGFPMNKFAKSEPATDIRDWDEINAWGKKISSVIRKT